MQRDREVDLNRPRDFNSRSSYGRARLTRFAPDRRYEREFADQLYFLIQNLC